MQKNFFVLLASVLKKVILDTKINFNQCNKQKIYNILIDLLKWI